MRICILTQTATDISDAYKEFFQGKDLFFLTFKQPNEQALAFLPKSTWSDGRNRLWEEVKGKFDYYVFIDDDLLFLKPRVTFAPLATYLSYKFLHRRTFQDSYEPATPAYFFSRLEAHLRRYRPEVLSALCLGHSVTQLDTEAMQKNSYVRRLGYFDAQFTVLSDFAASKMLPYDTKLSGWWSSQIPVYIYAHHVFKSKALAVSDIAIVNSQIQGGYVPDYDGFEDCKNMLASMSKATGKDFTKTFRQASVVDNLYGIEEIRARIPRPDDQEDYAANYASSLKGLETMLHPNLAF